MKLHWKRDNNRTFSKDGYEAKLKSPFGVALRLWVYRLDDVYFLSVNGCNCIISHRELRADDFKQAVREAKSIKKQTIILIKSTLRLIFVRFFALLYFLISRVLPKMPFS